MKKRIFSAAVIVLSMLFVQSCNNDDADNTARVKLKLVDFPGEYLEVNVNIIDVQYNGSEDENGWKSFESFEGPQIVDLTKLIGGVNLVLSDEIITTGTLKQIRLILGDDGNTIVVEGDDELPGEPLPLSTPSAQQSGLKLNIDTELEAGFSYTFILDWDVQKSIVKTGSDKYILKPVIRVEAEANSGSIEGIVTRETVKLSGVLIDLFELEAIIGEDEPFATTTTNDEGYFIFMGLEPANYKINIKEQENNYGNYESDPLEVKVGKTTDAGDIKL